MFVIVFAYVLHCFDLRGEKLAEVFGGVPAVGGLDGFSFGADMASGDG